MNDQPDDDLILAASVVEGCNPKKPERRLRL